MPLPPASGRHGAPRGDRTPSLMGDWAARGRVPGRAWRFARSGYRARAGRGGCWGRGAVRTAAGCATMRRFATTFLLGAVLISVGLALVILLVVATQEGTQDAAIRQLRQENRIQDAHNVNSARALMRAALSDLEAGRGEHARILARSEERRVGKAGRSRWSP